MYYDYTERKEINFSLLYYFPAVIVAGKPATGKSAALSTVISALNAQPGHSTSVKLMKVFPKSVEKLSDIFGYVDPFSGDWEDGIFTSIFKKAHKVIIKRCSYKDSVMIFLYSNSKATGVHYIMYHQ